jgi:hypothetical protein
MTDDTTQEDVRLAKCCCDHDWFGPHQQGCPAYDPNEWADWYKAQLTAYQSLGSPEYLAALVEENRAERVEVDALVEAAIRLHDVSLMHASFERHEASCSARHAFTTALDAMRRPEPERLRKEGL